MVNCECQITSVITIDYFLIKVQEVKVSERKQYRQRRDYEIQMPVSQNLSK